jgi:hypothetical protein
MDPPEKKPSAPSTKTRTQADDDLRVQIANEF